MDKSKSVLSTIENQSLTDCERIIEAGQKTFVEVGNALLRIRESRLYRAEFGTFDEYCLSRWGMAKTHANRLILGASVADNLAPMGAIPQTERVVRPLSRLEPHQQREAWKKANDKAAAESRPVTASDVGEMVVEVVPRQGISKSAIISGEKAEQDSENLWKLKSLWKKTGGADKKRFILWIETN